MFTCNAVCEYRLLFKPEGVQLYYNNFVLDTITFYEKGDSRFQLLEQGN